MVCESRQVEYLDKYHFLQRGTREKKNPSRWNFKIFMDVYVIYSIPYSICNLCVYVPNVCFPSDIRGTRIQTYVEDGNHNTQHHLHTTNHEKLPSCKYGSTDIVMKALTLRYQYLGSHNDGQHHLRHFCAEINSNSQVLTEIWHSEFQLCDLPSLDQNSLSHISANITAMAILFTFKRR